MFESLVRIVIKPICKVLLVLFINKVSINTTIFIVSFLSSINYKPLILYSIYYYNLLFNYFTSSSLRLITYTIKDRLKEASN